MKVQQQSLGVCVCDEIPRMHLLRCRRTAQVCEHLMPRKESVGYKT